MKTSAYYRLTFFLFTICLTLIACHEWEQLVPIPDTRVTDSRRVVIIEEFTGTSCPNCVNGILQTENIAEFYPDNVVVIAVHSNFLGAPASPGQTDLRTKDAQDIEVFLGGALFGKPEAAFNRLYDNTNKSYRYGPPDVWKTYVDEELKKPLQAELNISTIYDSVTRELNITLNVVGLENLGEVLHLHCGITESNIVADQLDNFEIIEDFIHNHVLRKLITPVSGEKIADQLTKDKSINKTYNFILPVDPVLWQAENCAVFAYVSLDETKKYILQAAEIVFN